MDSLHFCDKNTLTILISGLLFILFFTGNTQSIAKLAGGGEVEVPG